MPLKTVPGKQTRPTTDRMKETLFNILQDRIPGSTFLDMFAGSGAIGIEALSRGSTHACFVEHDRRAAHVIEENLAFTKLTDRAEVYCSTPETALQQIGNRTCFDLVFLDPPYGKNLEIEALSFLSEAPCTDEHTLYIIETSLYTSLDWIQEQHLQLVRQKKYKTNQHVFLQQMRA